MPFNTIEEALVAIKNGEMEEFDIGFSVLALEGKIAKASKVNGDGVEWASIYLLSSIVADDVWHKTADLFGPEKSKDFVFCVR